MSLGLKRGIVQLEPHDKQWGEIALQTIKTLKSILGDYAIDIQHIGSTAIQAISIIGFALIACIAVLPICCISIASSPNMDFSVLIV